MMSSPLPYLMLLLLASLVGGGLTVSAQLQLPLQPMPAPLPLQPVGVNVAWPGIGAGFGSVRVNVPAQPLGAAVPLGATSAPTGTPLGLAYTVPSPTNPLALRVAVNPAAPLKQVASSGVGQGLGSPIMQLLNQPENSLKHAIALQMLVEDMDAIDALAVGEVPQPGQGHFHCRLDNESVVASNSPRVDYHQVPSGAHQVACWTVDNAHRAASDVHKATVHIA